MLNTRKHSYFPHHETNRIKINLQYTIYHQSTANSERVAMCSKPLVKLLMVIHFIRLTVCDIFSIKLYLFVYLFIPAFVLSCSAFTTDMYQLELHVAILHSGVASSEKSEFIFSEGMVLRKLWKRLMEYCTELNKRWIKEIVERGREERGG